MTKVLKRGPWTVWKDVIFALFVREIRTGFSDKFGISWSVIQPVAFIFTLAFLRGRFDGADTHGVPTFTFMAIGLLLIQSFLKILGSAAQAVGKNKPLYAFRQVQPISAVIASSLFELLVKGAAIICIITIMYFMDMELQISDPLLFLSCFFLLWLLGVSIGLLFGIAELFISELRRFRELITRPLFFISGVFFSLQDFPNEYWQYLDWNPILHAIELTRFSVYSTYGDAGVNLSYLASVAFTFIVLSLGLYFAYWKQAISR
jgi:capsular polysaccharide transport system permease protein